MKIKLKKSESNKILQYILVGVIVILIGVGIYKLFFDKELFGDDDKKKYVLGRYVRLERADGETLPLTVMEIEVFDSFDKLITENISASLGPAEDDPEDKFAPKYLIDGEKEDWKKSGSGIATTKADPEAFVQLDFSTDQRISKVVITNNPDCCISRLQGTVLKIRNSDGQLAFMQPISEAKKEYVISVFE